MENNKFYLEMQVRDYECDLQAVVNNANYQHYLEHCRHEYLKTIGLDFAQLSAEGINLVVKRVEIEYHSPLRSGDIFIVDLAYKRISTLRFGFEQQISRKKDGQKIISALVIGTAINASGRPVLPDKIEEAFLKT